MTDIFPPPFSVVVQEIDALENTETQHGHLMALMRHRAMLAAAPQPPVVEQPQGEQEPVAWIENIGGGVSYNPYHEAARKLPDGVRFDLYTHPQPKREPLTEMEINTIWRNSTHRTTVEVVRAIEAVHGIGGEA